MQNKLLKSITTIALILSLTSCISVRDYKVPEIKDADLQPSSTKKVKVFTKWSSYSPMPGGNTIAVSEAHKKILQNTIEEAKCCILVDSENEANVVIEGWFRNESDSAALIFSVITGLSLYLVPSWINSKIHISANVESGKKTYNYDMQDSMLFAQWLPFVVAMPFRGNALKVEDQMNKNLYKNLLLQMKNDGLLTL